MSKNRLNYETLAGNLSAEDTFKQLLENLHLAIEDAQGLSSMAKARGDLHRGKQWQGFALNFQKIIPIVEGLAKDRTVAGVGFTQ